MIFGDTFDMARPCPGMFTLPLVPWVETYLYSPPVQPPIFLAEHQVTVHLFDLYQCSLAFVFLPHGLDSRVAS